MFTPTDNDCGAPKVLLAPVGPKMTEVAAEMAGGVNLHAFITEKYRREVTLPSIDVDLARSGCDRKDCQISYLCFSVTGITEDEFADA